MSTLRGKGRGFAFLKAHVNYDGDECLLWPFSRNHQGYGQLGHEGKVLKAHRVMCKLVNGDPPSDEHDAAHSCGRGHDGCIHPKHLSWKTPRENRMDANTHGTGAGRKRKQLAPDVIRYIRESPKSYLEIAAETGVYWGTVGKIRRGELYPNIPGRLELPDYIGG